jgi:hypothetical protein
MKPLFLSFEALPVAPLQLWVSKTCKPKGVQRKSNEILLLIGLLLGPCGDAVR